MEQHLDLTALRARGVRLTPQRLITLEVVRQSGGHLTAEEIHQKVCRRYPYISIATVYRTLQWLQDHGLVSAIDLGSRKRYEYMGGAPHHHLICEACGAATEVDDSLLNSLKQELRTRYGFEAVLQHLAIPGRCSTCTE